MKERHSILYGEHDLKWYGSGNEGDSMYDLYKCECGYSEKRYMSDDLAKHLQEVAQEIADQSIKDYNRLIAEGKTPQESARIVVRGE